MLRNKKIIPQFSIVYKICARKCLEFKASKLMVKMGGRFSGSPPWGSALTYRTVGTGDAEGAIA